LYFTGSKPEKKASYRINIGNKSISVFFSFWNLSTSLRILSDSDEAVETPVLYSLNS